MWFLRVNIITVLAINFKLHDLDKLVANIRNWSWKSLKNLKLKKSSLSLQKNFLGYSEPKGSHHWNKSNCQHRMQNWIWISQRQSRTQTRRNWSQIQRQCSGINLMNILFFWATHKMLIIIWPHYFLSLLT